MADKDCDLVIRGLDQLLRSEKAAMLDEGVYKDLERFCGDARSAAELGEPKEAQRLFLFARQLLAEEDNISGVE